MKNRSSPPLFPYKSPLEVIKTGKRDIVHWMDGQIYIANSENWLNAETRTPAGLIFPKTKLRDEHYEFAHS